MTPGTNSAVAYPAGYAELLATVKDRVRTARVRAHRAANTELLTLYWSIGQAILDRQQDEGWGTRVIDRLAEDLRKEFPDMRGLSRSNLKYMRQAAAAWPGPISQQPVGQLPWGHVTVLLDKLTGPSERDWYAAAAVEHGWSRKVLLNQILGGLHQRLGAAPSNFALRLVDPESELVQELTKDPYVFDFLAITQHARERDVEQALMQRIQDTLLEFGRGFAFVGRQVHFDVDGDDFYVDLLLFHVEQLRYVVVELKIGRFEPEHLGKLGFYVAVVDDRLRRGPHSPTVGILLCASRNEAVVRYALANNTAPMAVASYTGRPVDPEQVSLPLPGQEDLRAILDTPLPNGATIADSLPDDDQTEPQTASPPTEGPLT